MLNNHPSCPQSAMEKYRMSNQLPEYQTVPTNDPQKKNHSYYHDNTHIWNNDHQASSNMKVYGHIKDDNKKGDKRVKKLMQLQQQDQQLMEMQHRVWVNQTREENLQRLQQRKLERIGLQNLSSQQHEADSDCAVTKPNLSKGTLLGRAEFLWNQMNKQSKKYVNQLINPKILAMEESAIKSIGTKIANDAQIAQIHEELKLQNINKIRQQFVHRHIENQELQQRVGISPTRRTIIHRVATAKSKVQRHDVVEETLNLLENQKRTSQLPNFTSRPFTVGSVPYNEQDQQSFSFNGLRPGTTSNLDGRLFQTNTTKQQVYMDRLQQPSRTSNSQNSTLAKNPLDRTEYKGLYLAQAAEQYDSEFCKTLKSNSNLLKDTSTHQSRSSQKLMRPKQKRAMNNNTNDVNLREMNQMLESFEKKLRIVRSDSNDYY